MNEVPGLVRYHERQIFDSVCGTMIPDPDVANQFFDGRWTHHFCCAMCRRIFIDEWRGRRRDELECSSDGAR